MQNQVWEALACLVYTTNGAKVLECEAVACLAAEFGRALTVPSARCRHLHFLSKMWISNPQADPATIVDAALGAKRILM